LIWVLVYFFVLSTTTAVLVTLTESIFTTAVLVESDATIGAVVAGAGALPQEAKINATAKIERSFFILDWF
jgi:hypothetical protein